MAPSPQAIRQYTQDGYLSPIGAQSPAQARRYRQRLEAIEAFPRLPASGLLDKVDSEEAANRLRACRGLDPLASRPVDRRS